MCTDPYKPHLEQFGSAGAPAPRMPQATLNTHPYRSLNNAVVETLLEGVGVGVGRAWEIQLIEM